MANHLNFLEEEYHLEVEQTPKGRPKKHRGSVGLVITFKS